MTRTPSPNRAYILPFVLRALTVLAFGAFLTGCPDNGRQQTRTEVDNNFGSTPVGCTTAPCPAAAPVGRFVDDAGTPSTTSATVKTTLEVSNRVTTQALPTGFTDASDDRDNFKVEVVDATVTGNSIAATMVEVEALKRNRTAFSPRRKINVELQRVGTSQVFRSKYLRLVVDDADQATNTAQTLLTDWDASDESSEILGQIIKMTYTPASGSPVTSEATVGSATRSFVKMAIHILRVTPGTGAGVVTVAQATTRMKKWYRRVFAQISMTPQLLSVDVIDPPANVVSIANASGAAATGGARSRISFRIRRTPASGTAVTHTIGPHTPTAGHTPIQTADALAALIRTGATALTVRTVENSKVATTQPSGSADIIITGPAGERITIEALVQTDATQTVTVGRVNTNALDGYDGTNGHWIVGTLMQRATLHSCDTGADRIDVVVAGTINAQARGQSLVRGPVLPYFPQLGVDAVKSSTFVNANTMDGTDADCYNAAHETGHVLMNANHFSDPTELMMGSGTDMTNIVGGSKRFSENAQSLDYPSMSVVPETRIRSEGAGLLAPFV